ncbi:hypothetical protein BC830DRAFT_1132114 [Chytriomyces sp. MP71]|nr:hypothetical protein BC830DRAFT_1132114 [Chytriomyces sp. MP71]
MQQLCGSGRDLLTRECGRQWRVRYVLQQGKIFQVEGSHPWYLGFLDPVTACAMAINSGNACCQSKFPSKQAVVDAPATTTNAAAAAAPAVAPTANINANTTTAGNTVKPASKQPDSKPNGPLIAGLIVGVLAALVACYAAYVLYRRRRTRQALFQQYMIEKRPYSTTFSPTGSALALEPTGNSRFGAKGGREDAVGSLRSGGAALMSGVPDSINRPEKAGAGTVGTGSAAVSPGAGKTRIVRVVHPYRAVLNDELTLVVGNDVIMTKEHNDGWADGIDPVTGARGVFPTTCVMDPDEAAAASIAKKEFRLSARHSSIYRKSTSNSPPGSKPSSQTKDNRQSLFSFASNASRKSINKHTYRVIHNYVAALDDELTLTAGNDIIVQQEFDDGWAKGMEPASGKIGLFPMTCVARADDVNAGTAVNKHSSVYTKRTSSISRRSTIMRPESTITPPAPPAKDAESVVVVHAYDVTDSDELALVVGRTILLIEAFDDGWAEGTDTLTGKTGVFPMACVARLSADTVESVPPARPENFAKRRSSIKSVARNETRLKIVHQYNATQLDELTLEVGKELVLIKEFNDGWARGKIVGSQKVGLFPLVCVQK